MSDTPSSANSLGSAAKRLLEQKTRAATLSAAASPRPDRTDSSTGTFSLVSASDPQSRPSSAHRTTQAIGGVLFLQGQVMVLWREEVRLMQIF